MEKEKSHLCHAILQAEKNTETDSAESPATDQQESRLLVKKVFPEEPV